MKRKAKHSSICGVRAMERMFKKHEGEFYTESSNCEYSRGFVVSFTMSQICRRTAVLEFGRDTHTELFRGTINGYSGKERNLHTCTLYQQNHETLQQMVDIVANPADIYIQVPPKKCTHTLTKENSMLYNRLL